MSGYTDDEVVKRGVREGAVNFIQKPFEPAALLTKLAQTLDAAPTPVS